MTVRDHTQPCEHEDNRFGEGAELLFDIDEWVCKRSDCSGGREIVLRHAHSMTDSWGLVVAGYFDNLEDGDEIWYVKAEGHIDE